MPKAPEDPIRPKWLDPERMMYVKIHAETIHMSCVCLWEMDKSEPGFRLTARNRACVIHGKDGWI